MSSRRTHTVARKSDATDQPAFGCRAGCRCCKKKTTPITAAGPTAAKSRQQSSELSLASRWRDWIGSAAPGRYALRPALLALANLRRHAGSPARSRPGPEKPTFAPAATIELAWSAAASRKKCARNPRSGSANRWERTSGLLTLRVSVSFGCERTRSPRHRNQRDVRGCRLSSEDDLAERAGHTRVLVESARPW